MNRCLVFLVLLLESVSNATVRPIWTANEPDAGNPIPVVTDKAGNTYIAKFDDHTLTVVKRSARGEPVWATSLPNEAFPLAITVDRGGSVYVTGTIYNHGNPTNFADGVTWRFHRNGTLLWRVVYAGLDNTDDFPTGIGLDDAGRLYVVGRSFHRFDPSPAKYHFLIRYDAAGNRVWARRFDAGLLGASNTGTMAVNPQGGVAAISAYSIVSCSADGEWLWSWHYDGTFRNAFDSVSYGVAGFDAHEHLYVAGDSLLDGQRLPAVRKFSAEGTLLWTTPYRGPAENPGEPLDLRVDADGYAYLGLDVPIACQWVPGDERPELNCNYRPAVVKFAPHGTLLWASRFAGNPSYLYSFAGMALDGDGRVSVVARAASYDAAGDRYFAQDALFGQVDAEGNQLWELFFHSDSARELWPYAPHTDAKKSLYLPSELIDRGGGGNVDLLLAKFHRRRMHNKLNVAITSTAQDVIPGATAQFTAQVTGARRLRYQWRFNSMPLPGQTQPTLTLEGVTSQHAGDYSVEVRSPGVETVSTEVRLTVAPAGN